MLDSIYYMTLHKINVRFYLLHDITCNFWHENVKILQSFTQCYNGCHNATLRHL